MDNYLRISLLVIGGVIIFFIVMRAWWQRRASGAERIEPRLSSSESKSSAVQTPVQKMDDLVMISVMAKPGNYFTSYELVQAITSTGMRFGEMNIFHYYSSTTSERISLFSLASATKPGEFNLDRIGDLSCQGLTLFTNLSAVPNAPEVFERMVMTAEQLAEDLDGELRFGQREPWNTEALQRCRDKAAQYA